MYSSSQLTDSIRKDRTLPFVSSNARKVAAAAGIALIKLGDNPLNSAPLFNQRVSSLRVAVQTHVPPSLTIARNSRPIYPPLNHPPRAGGSSASWTLDLMISSG